MARSVISDMLQVYPFWLLDTYPIEPLALPVLTPLFGFSEVTAPEIQVETQTITEGNWYFKKKIIKGADVNNITIQRGVTWYDSDFWRWIISAITGDLTLNRVGFGPASLQVGGVTPRRSLMLVQFFSRPMLSGTGGLVAAAALEGGLAAGGAALSGGNASEIAAAGVTTGLLGGISAALQGTGLGPFEFAARIPAKAWMLYGSIPIRYKAGSDFNALSSAISIQQLELAVEYMEEISLVA